MAAILVVEDDLELRESLAMMLELLGHVVRQASDGKQALELLTATEGREFDLVVTDILMPEIDGIEVLRELRKFAPRIKSMAITGSRASSTCLLPVAEQLGAQLTLRKPFGVEDFREAVDTVLATQ